MENQDAKKTRKQGKRSPGYPMISLPEAIEKAKILWENDKNNIIPIEAAHEHLGYKPNTGYAARVTAALKKFDLIFENQDGIKLTNEAVDLILHEPTDEQYIKTVIELAFRPPIYEKIYKEYDGQIPSDATLKIKLIKDYEFNPESINDFISGFRKTIEFAKSIEGERGDPTDEKKKPDEGNDHLVGGILMQGTKETATGKTTNLSGKSIMEIPIPISLTEAVTIRTPYPLTEQAWNQMLNILKAYKPTLVPTAIGEEKDEAKEN
jgi:hypothetical protein